MFRIRMSKNTTKHIDIVRMISSIPSLIMYSWYVIQLHEWIFYVLEEFMLEAEATKGRDLRLDFRRIRSGASRDRNGDVVWLDFKSPYRHLVDVTVTSARTNTNVTRICARLPLHDGLAMGAQHGKLDADLRTYTLLGTPSCDGPR
jgi:hypothetical protein